MLRNFKAYQLAKEHYWHCKELKLPSFLKDQLLRASSSVALTLAEGSGKRTPADQRRFYAGGLWEFSRMPGNCRVGKSE
jgi:four helix bundle protein